MTGIRNIEDAMRILIALQDRVKETEAAVEEELILSIEIKYSLIV